MKRTLVAFSIVAVVACAAGISSAAVQINLYAAPAPNNFGSPSWDGWVSNTKTALQNGNSSLGDPNTDPTAFYTIGQFSPTDVAVTGFASWKGVASPATPFDRELGQRLHFPWVISSDTGANDIKLSNVGNMDIYYLDTDVSPLEKATFGDSATYRFSAYSSTRIGIKADGTIVNSGSADQLVSKIIYVGYGNAFAVYTDSTGVSTNQQMLDGLIGDLSDGSMEYWRGTVGYFDDSGTQLAGANLTVVPEPATMVLLAVGGVGMLIRRRRAAR